MASTRSRIVILGGGFGGVSAARRLERLFGGSQDVEIVLISDQNFLLFTPMLPEVPSSSIEAKHIVSPIRAFFRRAEFMNAEVLSIDLQERTVSASHCPQCESADVSFDHLVLALGSTTNFFGLPGVAERALPMKTLSDAMTLRNHIIDLFEHADMQPSPEVRKAMLTFVVAGGGFAGVETVAEIGDFLRTAGRFYRRIQAADVRVVWWWHCWAADPSRDQRELRAVRRLRSFARTESRSFSTPRSLPQHLAGWNSPVARRFPAEPWSGPRESHRARCWPPSRVPETHAARFS